MFVMLSLSVSTSGKLKGLLDYGGIEPEHWISKPKYKGFWKKFPVINSHQNFGKLKAVDDENSHHLSSSSDRARIRT